MSTGNTHSLTHSIKVVIAKKSLQKIQGLIGKQKPYPLLINTRFGIHTFGLNFPIDVIILSNQHVVKLKSNLKQNRVFIWNPVYSQIVELPSGFIKTHKIKTGSKVVLESQE